MDAVVLLLLTWEIERDEAIPARDKALAQAEMFRRGMKAARWMAREHFERMDPVRWHSRGWGGRAWVAGRGRALG